MNLLAELREGLGISWSAIRANKMRSILTTLGIVIGVVTVTLMGTAITGLDRAFLKNISSIGADVFYVERFNWFAGSREAWMKMQKQWRRSPTTRPRSDTKNGAPRASISSERLRSIR